MNIKFIFLIILLLTTITEINAKKQKKVAGTKKKKSTTDVAFNKSVNYSCAKKKRSETKFEKEQRCRKQWRKMSKAENLVYANAFNLYQSTKSVYKGTTISKARTFIVSRNVINKGSENWVQDVTLRPETSDARGFSTDQLCLKATTGMLDRQSYNIVPHYKLNEFICLISLDARIEFKLDGSRRVKSKSGPRTNFLKKMDRFKTIQSTSRSATWAKVHTQNPFRKFNIPFTSDEQKHAVSILKPLSKVFKEQKKGCGLLICDAEGPDGDRSQMYDFGCAFMDFGKKNVLQMNRVVLDEPRDSGTEPVKGNVISREVYQKVENFIEEYGKRECVYVCHWVSSIYFVQLYFQNTSLQINVY